MWWSWWLVAGACGERETPPVEPVAASRYLPGMWLERARTVRAGIEEAADLLEDGRREAAAELVSRVRRGSFEPELAPLVRRELGRAALAEIQYRFGQAAAAARAGDADGWEAATGALLEALDRAARSLDGRRAVLDR